MRSRGDAERILCWPSADPMFGQIRCRHWRRHCNRLLLLFLLTQPRLGLSGGVETWDEIGQKGSSTSAVRFFWHGLGDDAIVDGLKVVHVEPLLKGDDHVAPEDGLEGLVLDEGMAEGAWARNDGVVVAGVGGNVVAVVATTDGVAAAG